MKMFSKYIDGLIEQLAGSDANEFEKYALEQVLETFKFFVLDNAFVPDIQIKTIKLANRICAEFCERNDVEYFKTSGGI